MRPVGYAKFMCNYPISQICNLFVIYSGMLHHSQYVKQLAIVSNKFRKFGMVELNLRQEMDAKLLDKKIELIQWLSTLEDSLIIEKLVTFRKEETKDWWDNVSDEEKVSIAQGIADADNKKMKPHLEAKQLYEKWL